MEGDVYRQITELCERLRGETDHDKFMALVAELDRLLDIVKDDVPKLPPRVRPDSAPAA